MNVEFIKVDSVNIRYSMESDDYTSVYGYVDVLIKDEISYISYIETYPRFRKNGYAKEALSTVISLIKNNYKEVETIHLTVAPRKNSIDKNSLIKFYEGLGFILDGEIMHLSF